MAGRKNGAAAPLSFEPGHFTRGISSFLVGWTPTQHEPSRARQAAGARNGVDQGKAFGGRATVGLPGTPKGPKPGRM